MAGKELIRLTTAGSVDDGKSTLIGRLLFDCNQIYQDHIDAVKRSGKTADGEIDYALFTDGLSSEREQGITIDVAYRYFSTKNRRFIVADVPGHEQYTKNMVTGASQADVAIILVDARHGMTRQSKRHLFIASLLGIKHVLIVVNKMDLVDYNEQTYSRIVSEVQAYVAKLNINDLQFIPLSALKGDMVVNRTNAMPWYDGKTLLNYLETVQVASDRNLIDFRFPVQYVIRPNQDERYYAGTIESGSLKVGEEIMILPSKRTSVVSKIMLADQPVPYAFAPQAISIALEDDIDIGRGDMIVRPKNQTIMSRNIDATICWLDDEPLDPAKRYLIKHTTKQVGCHIDELVYAINIDSSDKQSADTLKLNEIGRVSLSAHAPLMFDSYQKNRGTGAFILIDEASHHTVAAGMIRGEAQAQSQQQQTYVFACDSMATQDSVYSAIMGLAASSASRYLLLTDNMHGKDFSHEQLRAIATQAQMQHFTPVILTTSTWDARSEESLHSLTAASATDATSILKR